MASCARSGWSGGRVVRGVAEHPVPEVLALPAAKDDMSGGVSSLCAVATRVSDAWHPSAIEEVVQPDLLGSQLHQQRAL